MIPSPQTPTFTTPSTSPLASVMATPGTLFPFHDLPQDVTHRLYAWECDEYDHYWAVKISQSPTKFFSQPPARWQTLARQRPWG